MWRRWWAIAAACGVGIAAAILWWIIPPSIVRQLPPGQTLVYIDYAPVRALGQQQIFPAIQRARSYASFVRDSGFDFERDLDAVALSLDGNPLRPRNATAILAGHFSPAFTRYLQQHALRHTTVAGVEAFVFPGWARPQQPLTIAMLGGRELLVTNAADAATVIAHARRWWAAAPPLWRAGNNWRTLVGYMAVNTLQLEAGQALDGSQAPWRGVQRVEAQLGAGGGGIVLDVSAQTDSGSAAAEERAWVQSQVQSLRPLLTEEPGEPTLRALLDRLESGQDGRRVWLRLRVDPATLSAWSRQEAERQQP